MNVFILRLRSLFFAIFHEDGWHSLKKSDVLVVRHDADCGYIYNGVPYSPIIDTILEDCLYKNLRVQTVAKPFSRLVGDQAFSSPVAFNRIFFVIAVLVRVLSIFIGRSNGSRWGTSRKAAVWLSILKRVQPKVVIGIQPDLSLCRSCRALNIPVYDIQHGAIGKSDQWYGELLPKEAAESDLPSGFLCWDNQSARVLREWAPLRGVTVDIVGNPWFQRFQYPSEKDVLVAEAMKDGHIFSDEKPVILISLQWGLHIHYYPEKDFNKVMCNALASVVKRTHERYNWLLRLHPIQLTGDEGRYCEEYLSREFGGVSGVEWRKASLIPLPLLLSQADLHITDMSAVVIEASWFGLPSALLNPYLNAGESLEGLYEFERESGIATVIEQSVNSIESWIEEKSASVRGGALVDISTGGIHAVLEKALTRTHVG